MSYTLRSTGTSEIHIIPSKQRGNSNDLTCLPKTKNTNIYDVDQGDIPNKGCLLIGAVYAVRNLPNDPIKSNQYFFRILYSENSSKSSSLMNARIPILTSSFLYYDDILQWEENNTFRLEIPSSANQLQGEVIVSIYRSKIQGGNEVIGQSIFSLSTICSSAISNGRSSDYESRIVQGEFPLNTKPESCAEVDVHFELIWKEDSTTLVPNSTVIPIRESKDDSTRLDRPSTSGMIRSQSSSSRPQSAGRAGTASNIVRKIASSGLKKKREDQLRIERENKAIRSRLLKLATKTSTDRNVYGPNPISKAPGSSIGQHASSSKKSKVETSDVELLDQLNKLKQEIIEKSNENSNLRGQINKLKSHANKFQQVNNRIKRTAAKISDVAFSKPELPVPTVTDRSDKSWILTEYYLGDASVSDRELHDIIDEHFELQNIRRGLVRRIEMAKKSMSTNDNEMKRSEYDSKVLGDRLSILYPSYTGKQSQYGDDLRSDDIQIYNRLKKAKHEYLGLQVIYDEGLLSKSKFDFEEKSAMLQIMKVKKSKLEQDVSNALYERDLWQERLQLSIGSKFSQHVKDSLTKLKAILLKLRRDERISNLIIDI